MKQNICRPAGPGHLGHPSKEATHLKCTCNSTCWLGAAHCFFFHLMVSISCLFLSRGLVARTARGNRWLCPPGFVSTDRARLAGKTGNNCTSSVCHSFIIDVFILAWPLGWPLCWDECTQPGTGCNRRAMRTCAVSIVATAFAPFSARAVV